MKFSEKLRMARKAKGMTQAELSKQAGLGLRTIIAYEKGETYPQKRSTYQTLAGLLDVPLDYLRNEESEPALQQPLPKAAWEAKVQQLARDLGLTPRLTYEEYCEGFRKNAANRGVVLNDDYFRRAQQPPTYPLEVTRPARVADFPVLLRIYRQWAAIYKSDNDQQAESITENLVRWLDARQCFVVEEDGQPVTWFALEFPQAGEYAKGGKATPAATMTGPYAVISQRIAISRMYSFCQTCCPRLQIWVEAGDTAALACWKEHWMQEEDTTESPNAKRLILMRNR